MPTNALLASYRDESLLGDIANHINDSLNCSQPGIAFAAALSFMGALMSGRVISSTGIEPCIYSFAVAESGVGKSQAQNIIRDIVVASGIEKRDEFLTGKPASDAGLMTSLCNAPRQLLIWDELGVALSALSQTKASHEAMILSQIMELYSAAGKPLKGKQYSTKSRTDIPGAWLSIFGSSAPVRFFGSLNQSFIEDGFLPRWFLFFSEPYKEKEPISILERFDSIVERVKRVDGWQSQSGDLASVATECTRKTITIKIPKTFKTHVKDIREKSKSPTERIFWSRAIEQLTKFCLCLCESGEPPSEQVIFDSALFITEMIERTVKTCEKSIFQNSRTRDYNDLRDKFLALVEPGHKISRSEVTKRSHRWCTGRERDEIIDGFVSSDIWTKESVHISDFKKSTVYRAL